MKKISLKILSLSVLVSLPLIAIENEIPEIKYDSFTLDNGLTVIVHGQLPLNHCLM